MMPLNTFTEKCVIEMLQKTGPSCFDDLVRYLTHLSWGEVFVAIDRMSRDGRVLLRHLGYSTYQVTLSAQFAFPAVHPFARRTRIMRHTVENAVYLRKRLMESGYVAIMKETQRIPGWRSRLKRFAACGSHSHKPTALDIG
jgi:hypothetical protein